MDKIRIDSPFIITGTGDTIKDGSVVTQGNEIIYCGESEHAPSVTNVVNSPVVMPGLWETHAHYMGIYTPSMETTAFTNPQVAALRCVWDVRETLHSGVTSVREVGGLGIYLNKAISENAIVGPRIYGAGKILSTTGGHADMHGLNLDVYDLLGKVAGNQFGELTDGVAECYKGVRKQIRNGAEIIKYCASGGVMSEIDHPVHQQYSAEEQKAIVEEAARAEIAVAAHCHGAPGIKSALEAGVTTIEHGTYLDEDLADLMIEKDAILVPTRYVIEKIMAGAEKMGIPEYAMNKMRGMYEQHTSAIKMAIKKGVTIAMGTDMFSSGPNAIFRYGDNSMELEYLVQLGMTTEQAIITGTSHGPPTLGGRAPKSGVLQEGYEADIILLNSNPLDDITVLQNRENIANVMKQGQFVH